jgi:poly(beta-D-mannuronate) lyase
MPSRQLIALVLVTSCCAGSGAFGAVLQPPSGYLQATVFKKSTWNECGPIIPPYTASLEFTSKYEGSGASRDEVDPESDAEYKAQIKPITDMERLITSVVSKYMKSASPVMLECIMKQLSAWAEARALEGEATNHTGRSIRKWSLGSLTGAYMRLKWSSSGPLNAYPKQAERIEAWFGEVGDLVKVEWPADTPLDKLNNHYYWAAWAMMSTAVVTNRKDLFDSSTAILKVFTTQVDAEGYLPNELKRATRADQYHAYSMLPISMIAAYAIANGVSFETEGNGALGRFAIRVKQGLEHPEIFDAKTGVTQDRSALESTMNWAWLEPYCWTVTCDASFNAELNSNRPLAVTRLGGDLTAVFAGAKRWNLVVQ